MSDEPRGLEPRKSQTRELLQLSSGVMLAIDQFMLGTRQFLDAVEADLATFRKLIPGAETTALANSLRRVTAEFGGCVIKLPRGDYWVHRNPAQLLIAVVEKADSEISDEEVFDDILVRRDSFEPAGRVLVETRCVVFLDLSLLADQATMKEYVALRRERDEKGARDFLRSLGAAVRYGFQRLGDELSVQQIPGEARLAIWPDITD